MGSSLSGAMVSSVMYRARWTAHSSFCSIRMAPTSRMIASSLGKMPTTLVRRLISPLGRSMGLVELILSQCSAGEAHEGEHVDFGLVQQGGELGQLGAQLVGDLTPLLAGGLRRVLGEGGGDEGRDDAAAALAGVRQRVAHEVDAGVVEEVADRVPIRLRTGPGPKRRKPRSDWIHVSIAGSGERSRTKEAQRKRRPAA